MHNNNNNNKDYDSYKKIVEFGLRDLNSLAYAGQIWLKYRTGYLFHKYYA